MNNSGPIHPWVHRVRGRRSSDQLVPGQAEGEGDVRISSSRRLVEKKKNFFKLKQNRTQSDIWLLSFRYVKLETEK